MRKLQVIRLTDAEKFEEHVNEFVSTHKIINITYAIRQGYAGPFGCNISALVAFIEYEETDDVEPEEKKIKELEEENAELKKVLKGLLKISFVMDKHKEEATELVTHAYKLVFGKENEEW